jgi:hypothetical protein
MLLGDASGRVVAAALLLAALAVPNGCGSSGDNSNSASDQIKAVVTRAFTHSDPAQCETLATNRWLEQNFGEGGGSTLEECEFESTLPGLPEARSVRFDALQVHGASGVATVSVAGGAADGSRLQLQVVRQGGQWKLDYLRDMQIDRRRFDAATRRDLVAQGTTGREAACAVGRVHRIFGTDEIERALVSGKTRIFGTAQVTCFGRKTLVHEFTLVVRHAAPREIPRQILDCVTRKIIGATSTAEFRVLFAAPDKFTGYLHDEVEAAAKACGRESQAGLLPEPSPS